MTNEELVLAYQQGDEEALSKILEENKRMVMLMASKFYTSNTNAIDKEDLIQEGYIGLMKACKKYDFNHPKRVRFINYGVQWVYKSMHDYITMIQTNEEVSLNKKDKDGCELGNTLISNEDYICDAEKSMYYQYVRRELDKVMEDELTLLSRNIVQLSFGWNSERLYTKDLVSIYQIDKKKVEKIRANALKRIRESKWGRIERRNRLYDRWC